MMDWIVCSNLRKEIDIYIAILSNALFMRIAMVNRKTLKGYFQ